MTTETPNLTERELAEKALKEFNAIAPRLSRSDWTALLADAKRRAAANSKKLSILETLKSATNRPGLYQERPKGQHLVDFLRSEWLHKGWNPPKVSRTVVALYDPPLDDAIAAFESRTGVLPKSLSFVKTIKRLTAQQRQPS